MYIYIHVQRVFQIFPTSGFPTSSSLFTPRQEDDPEFQKVTALLQGQLRPSWLRWGAEFSFWRSPANARGRFFHRD